MPARLRLASSMNSSMKRRDVSLAARYVCLRREKEKREGGAMLGAERSLMITLVPFMKSEAFDQPAYSVPSFHQRRRRREKKEEKEKGPP